MEDLGEPDAVKGCIAKVAMRDVERSERFTRTIRWQGIELAGTTPITVAASNILTHDLPFGFRGYRSRRHISNLLFVEQTLRGMRASSVAIEDSTYSPSIDQVGIASAKGIPFYHADDEAMLASGLVNRTCRYQNIAHKRRKNTD